jgi:hypothetical protein
MAAHGNGNELHEEMEAYFGRANGVAEDGWMD